MEEKSDFIKKEREEIRGIIHILLFHTYTVFLFAIIFGLIFDHIFIINLFKGELFKYIGLLMITLGSIGIYWSQATTKPSKSELNKERDLSFFYRGPYKYTRNPTNLSLTVMSIGLGLLINSFFSVLFILASYCISRFFYIRKQDSILEKRYGQVFLEYKKKVKNWI